MAFYTKLCFIKNVNFINNLHVGMLSPLIVWIGSCSITIFLLGLIGFGCCNKKKYDEKTQPTRSRPTSILTSIKEDKKVSDDASKVRTFYMNNRTRL